MTFAPYNFRIGGNVARRTWRGDITVVVRHEANALVDGPLGPIALCATDAGISSLTFVDTGEVIDMVRRAGRAETLLARAVAQLDDYFAGRSREFDVDLDLVGTPFQLDAWEALRRIPYGQTISYKAQALSMNRPTATRAVGAANGRNPVPIIVPCHRVIGADGSLTGFSAGIERKIWLLDHEARHAEP